MFSTRVAWLLETALQALPGSLRARIHARHISVVTQFVQFGMVGTAGFAVDTAVVYALRGPAGLYVAGAAAYAVAVTTTWWVNRIWTFQSLSNIGPIGRQWVRYAAANIPGLLLNLGAYFTLVTGSSLCATHPVLAVAAGALAGMFANFTLSRTLVFR